MATRKQQIEYGVVAVLILGAAVGWLYVGVNQHLQSDPTGIVKRHFLFYPQYSHGVWQEGPCTHDDPKSCREITYTVPVQACGPVTFDWSVFPGDDADRGWNYNGTHPQLDETAYPFYAMLGAESHFMDSPALGKPLPTTCRLK